VRDREILAEQDVSGQSCLFDPLRVLDALRIGPAVPLIHCLKRPAGLPECLRHNPRTKPAVQEEAQPGSRGFSSHQSGRPADLFDLS
jgi:hypothetical protein